MSSYVLNIKSRRELSSLLVSYENFNDEIYNKNDISIWLFEWYVLKGKKLPLEEENKNDEIPLEELKFLQKILSNLPENFPMIRYSQLWSKWLFPNVKLGISNKITKTWIEIVSLMDEKFPEVFVSEIDIYVESLNYYLTSDDPLKEELIISVLTLIRKLLTVYIQPKKGFNVVVRSLFESLGAFYKSTIAKLESLDDDNHLKEKESTQRLVYEIVRVVQTVVSEKHIAPIELALNNEVLNLNKSKSKNKSNLNYTNDLIELIICEESKYNCFIPAIIRKMHEISENNDNDDNFETRSDENKFKTSGEYLVFYLYLNINLKSVCQFKSNIKYLNECFGFFIEKNTFNIRESNRTNYLGFNIKLKIFEDIFEKLQNCIKSEDGLNSSHIYKCYEYCILIDPIKSLDTLSDIFSVLESNENDTYVGKEKKRKATFDLRNSINGLELTTLSFISSNFGITTCNSHIKHQNGNYFNSNGVLNKLDVSKMIEKEDSLQSLTNCISAFINTFTKLHDLPLLFSKLTEIFSDHVLDLELCEAVLLDQSILRSIIDIGNSMFTGKTIVIFDSFFDFVKQNKTKNLLHEYISTSWFGVLMLAIPVCESSLNDFEGKIKEVHEYIMEFDSNSNTLHENQKSFVHIALTCGTIHLLRKIISWNIEDRDDLREIMNQHYLKMEEWGTRHYNSKCHEIVNGRVFYLKLSKFVFYLTKLRDLRTQASLEEMLKIFIYYEELVSIISNLECKDTIERILTELVSVNISNFGCIGNYFKSIYLREKSNESTGLTLFMNSLLDIYVFDNTSNNIDENGCFFPLKSVVKVPYLLLLLFKETCNRLNIAREKLNFHNNLENKKRKIDKNTSSLGNIERVEIDKVVLCNVLDFWNNKQVIVYLVNNKDLYEYNDNNSEETVSKERLNHYTFEVIYQFYYDILIKFEFNDNSDLSLSIIEKAVFGILTWIKIEKEAKINDLLIMLRSSILCVNSNGTNSKINKKNDLNKYLSLLTQIKNKKIFENLTSILKEIIFPSENDHLVEHHSLIKILLDEMEKLDWFLWLNTKIDVVVNECTNSIIKDNASVDSSLNGIKDSNCIIQIQFLIELFKYLNFENIVDKFDVDILKKRILGRHDAVTLVIKGLCALKHLEINHNVNVYLIYIIKICELYICVSDNIMEWEIVFEDSYLKQNYFKDYAYKAGKENKYTNCDYKVEHKKLDIIKGLLVIMREILNMPEKMFSNKEINTTDQGNMLLDFVIAFVVNVILRTFNNIMYDCKGDKDKLSGIYSKFGKVYVNIFEIYHKIVKMNIKYGMLKIDQENIRNSSKKTNEWVRYFIKCTLEGSSMINDYFKEELFIYRHMKLYDNISGLINNSPATGFVNEVIKMVNTETNEETDVFLDTISLIDFTWSIIKNKGYIYKSLSPGFKKSKHLNFEKWGVSDNLFFNLELLVLKLIKRIESILTTFKVKANCVIYTQSLIKLSNIVSILYSCCVRCFVSDPNNNKIGLMNNKVTSLSNLVLTLSYRFSSIGIEILKVLNFTNKTHETEKEKELYYLSIFESLTISPYIPLYTLLNPLWDQSSKKKNNNNKGHIDVWIYQFHLIQESLKQLISLGDNLLFFKDKQVMSYGVYSYIQHFKRISRLYPLIVSQITKNKVQRYSISIVCDLINYINILNKRIQQHDSELPDSDRSISKSSAANILNDDVKVALDLSIQIIENTCLYHILGIIDDHCKQSLFVMLRDEQRIIFKRIIKKSGLKTYQGLER